MRNNLLEVLSCLAFLSSVQGNASAMDIEENIENTEQLIANCMKQINALNKELEKLEKEMESFNFNPSCSKSDCLQNANSFILRINKRNSIQEELEDAEEWLEQLNQLDKK